MAKINTLSVALKDKINSSYIPRSFDVIGDIAVIEVPRHLKAKEKLIGNTLLGLHKHIKVVCKKLGGHKGKLRIQKYAVIAGEKRKETLYKESNCSFKLNIEKTYFSVRLANERKRIALLVHPDESILVMFSGIAPYPIVLSKNTKAKKILGIELNKLAHKYALENLSLNKTKNISLLQGDVKRLVPMLKVKFDRILMPLPKGAIDYLDIALKKIQKGGTIHFYDFLHEDEFHKAEEKILSACKSAKKKCKILSINKCGQQGPRIYRICVDFKVN